VGDWLFNYIKMVALKNGKVFRYMVSIHPQKRDNGKNFRYCFTRPLVVIKEASIEEVFHAV